MKRILVIALVAAGCAMQRVDATWQKEAGKFWAGVKRFGCNEGPFGDVMKRPSLEQITSEDKKLVEQERLKREQEEAAQVEQERLRQEEWEREKRRMNLPDEEEEKRRKNLPKEERLPLERNEHLDWVKKWERERSETKKAQKANEAKHIAAGGEPVNPAQVARWEAKKQELKDTMLKAAQERWDDEGMLKYPRLNFDRGMRYLAEEKLERQKKVAERGENRVAMRENLEDITVKIQDALGSKKRNALLAELYKRWNECEGRHGVITAAEWWDVTQERAEKMIEDQKREEKYAEKYGGYYEPLTEIPPFKTEMERLIAGEVRRAWMLGMQLKDWVGITPEQAEKLEGEFPFLTGMSSSKREELMTQKDSLVELEEQYKTKVKREKKAERYNAEYLEIKRVTEERVKGIKARKG